MAKYTLMPRIRGYIEWQLEHYHETVHDMESYRRSLVPSGTAEYGGIGGRSSETTDPTASTAMKLTTSPYLIQMERSCRAIERVLKHCDKTDLKLIDLIYWRRSHTVTGAGFAVGLAKTPAYYRVNKILCAIAAELGLISADEI